MINHFIFQSVTRIEFGTGVTVKAGEEAGALGMKKCLIVTDPGVVKAGLLDPIVSSLERSGCEHAVYDQVVPNPRIETIQAGVEVYRKAGVDGIIAIGGGSSIDAAKAIGIVINNGGTIDMYEYGRKPIARGIPPLIAIPTTTGTGSEVTPWAVITNPSREDKMDVGDGTTASSPTLALVDPELTKTLPPDITAATGADALTHAIEGYTSWTATPMSDILNLAAIKIIAKALRPAVAGGECMSSRLDMLYGSTLAGLGFSNSSCGLVHAMAQKLGGVFDLPHGVANAIFLPDVMEFNLIACPDRFGVIAEAMQEYVDGLSPMDAARLAVVAVRKLFEEIGIPKLKDLKIDPKRFDDIALGSLNYLDAKGNARPATARDTKTILQKVYQA